MANSSCKPFDNHLTTSPTITILVGDVANYGVVSSSTQATIVLVVHGSKRRELIFVLACTDRIVVVHDPNPTKLCSVV